MFKNRVEQDLKTTNHAFDQEIRKKDELERQLNGIQTIIENTEATIKIVYAENCQKDQELQLLIKQFERLCYDKVKLQEEILKLLEDQLTNDKVTAHLNKIVKEIQQKNRDMEIIQYQTENTSARTLMDIETQRVIHEGMDKIISELSKEMSGIEKEIDQYTAELNTLFSQMNRKQREFDILNVKLEHVKKELSESSVNISAKPP